MVESAAWPFYIDPGGFLPDPKEGGKITVLHGEQVIGSRDLSSVEGDEEPAEIPAVVAAIVGDPDHLMFTIVGWDPESRELKVRWDD